jgi:hypothetical protein
MSRTFRKWLDGEYIINGDIIHPNEPKMDHYSTRGFWGWGFKYRIRVIKKQRDRKPWNKPPKWFKQERRRNERAKVNNAMRVGKEPPLFKKADQWDWT